MYKRTLSWILVTAMTFSSIFAFPALASDTPAAAEGLASVSFESPTAYALSGTPTNLLSGKFDSGNTPDLVALPTAASELSLLLGNTDGTFATPVYVTTSASPIKAASGNFNGDKVTDLAVATDRGVDIFLGTGSGTFVKHTEYTELAKPNNILVDDFNGDGRADFLVSNATTDTITVYLGNGDGTFTLKGSSLVGLIPGEIVVADTNGDGKRDLVVSVVDSTSKHAVTILWGDGNGLFSSRTIIDNIGTTTSPYISAMAVADLNGDSKLDIVLADRAGFANVLFGNGFGGFATPLALSVGNEPTDIAIGDFNSDGKPDIAVTSYTNNSVSVIASDGKGKFAPKQNFAAGTGPSELIAADFDGDGDTDLAILLRNGVSVHLNSYKTSLNNIRFEVSDLGITEGASSSIKVIRTGDLRGAVSIEFSTKSGTAKSGTHFVPYSGTLTWADGESTPKTISYATVDDEVYNGHLSYSYVLSNGVELPIKITDNDAPPAPTGLTATAGDTRVKLVWNSVKDASYRIYYSTTPTGFTEDYSVPVDGSNTITVTGLTNGATYYFAVKAVHGNQSSAISGTVSSKPTGNDGVNSGDVIVQRNEGGYSYVLQIPSTSVLGTSSVTITDAMVEKFIKAQDQNRNNRDNRDKKNNKKYNKDIFAVVVDTPASSTRLVVTIPPELLARIYNNSEASFGISSSLYSITLDHKAIGTLLNTRTRGDVVIDTAVTTGPQQLYEINITVNGRTVSDLGKGKATIELPYNLSAREKKNSVVLYYIKDNGKLKSTRGSYNKRTGMVEFKTSTIRDYVIGVNQVAFKDVKNDKWYRDAIEFIASRGIASGYGDDNFGPDKLLTRGQFIVMLLNAYDIAPENANNYRGKSQFRDIGNTYYTDYLVVAKGMGLVNGVGDNRFAPDRTITRQEMLVMLYNTLALLDELPEVDSYQTGNFIDTNLIAPWANDAVTTFIAVGVVSGNNGRINPRSATTRGEMAQILYNLLSY